MRKVEKKKQNNKQVQQILLLAILSAGNWQLQ